MSTNNGMEFKKFTQTITINSHKVKVQIIVKVFDDYEFLPGDLYDNADAGRIQKLIDQGKLFLGTVHVTAYAAGIEGFDSLGAVELVPNNAFNSKPFEKSVNRCLKDNGMVDNAIDDLKKQIQGMFTALTDKAAQFKKYSPKRGAK